MIHNEYSHFLDLPADAQRAFDRALKWFQRTVGPTWAWSDIARALWVDKMQYARPGVTGWRRAKGLVIGARLTVLNVAKMGAEARGT